MIRRLDPGFAGVEFVALGTLWQALPEAVARHGRARRGMWEVALLLALDGKWRQVAATQGAGAGAGEHSSGGAGVASPAQAANGAAGRGGEGRGARREVADVERQETDVEGRGEGAEGRPAGVGEGASVGRRDVAPGRKGAGVGRRDESTEVSAAGVGEQRGGAWGRATAVERVAGAVVSYLAEEELARRQLAGVLAGALATRGSAGETVIVGELVRALRGIAQGTGGGGETAAAVGELGRGLAPDALGAGEAGVEAPAIAGVWGPLGIARQAIAGGEAGEVALEGTRTAGLVLVAVYLPMLFDRLEITDGGGFRGPGAVERGMDALAALVWGEAPVAEPRRLERLLCGVPGDRPVRAVRPLAEAGLVQDLLGTVIARWDALGRTSVAGLREAFLQREGLLRRGEAGWTLEVSPRAYDMLIDRLPWSYGLIRLPWMCGPLQVKWRN